MNNSKDFERVKKLIFEENANAAANAIRECILTFMEFNLFSSLEEFLCLVDLDYAEYWDIIADDIASRAERKIRNGNLHPNKLKPWQNCSNYPEQFRKISNQKEWRRLHSAIDAIIKRISARFNC